MGFWKRLRLTRQPDGTSLPVGIAVLLVGTVLVLLGYLWEGTWEDVSIEVGAAAAVGGIVLLYKQRFWRKVDERATKAGAAAAEAIEQRLVSHRLMVEARQAAEGSGKRLKGRLRLLINDEWALTDAGLEGTKSDLLYPWRSIGRYGENLERAGDFQCPPNCQEGLWDEAKTYAGRLAI